ncbi:glycerol uptake facilitator protein [Halobacillus andaensis]|uniref:Glycerol uptake facilitator protein n=1 Tax=Halobacillus andaensis TaxID=1176239 RepID=A0A917B9Y5_HALAA|nr:MIP/aquaporin family protein [Halobacillus andaensis]MBP2005503.1 glycerol uptake facilitator protein [Halobacillus andaensis]GGF32012.1 glycerol uptake facilitator protein [Halobacillus andaensis]
MSEFAAEVIGTMILIIFGGGVVGGVVLKDSKAEGAGWVVITIGWGLAVTMAVYAVGNFSGAHINPAVTLGFAAVGEFEWAKVPLYITAQMIGAFIGGAIVFFNYLAHWDKTTDPGLKLAVFSTDPAVRSPFSNLVSEMVGTFVLLMGLLFIGANEFTDGLNPLIVGALIVAIGMSLGGATGYAINPARDLGPRIAHALLPIPGKGGSDWGYAWIPIVGPILGGIYGAVFYRALFIGEYTVLFWVLSVLMAVILVGAASSELKKGETKADQIEEKVV